jgi:serine/threonine-protein kinase
MQRSRRIQGVPLAPGVRLGPYTIVAQIGAGGMGEVYRATDTNLGRDVAIKVLPEAFAQDAERLARFQREARTLAALNHPNIAIIHGLEKANDGRALVMELVEGPTLADRIAQGAIPIDEAFPIARQIAEALDAAHEQSIVHRDLKPANVKLRPDGVVKVLDFGLAKTMEPADVMSPGQSVPPTITSPAMTRAGVILGTAAYMSPEQAKGRPADRRSDVWAFGCVLYEMLAGRRPFDGEDVSDTLAAVLRSEPAWSSLPPDLPTSVVALIKGSLEKDRRRRIGGVSAALFVLTDPSAVPAVTPQGGQVAARRRRVVAIAATLLGAAAIAAGGWWIGSRSRPVEPKLVTRFTVPLRNDEQFATNGANFIALSPDGKYLAYVANERVNLRPLDRQDAAVVRGTETRATPNLGGGTRNAFFSPDGQWIGFAQAGQLRKVPINGGAPSPIAPLRGLSFSGISWDDDTILYGTGGGGSIVQVAEGGKPEVVVSNLSGMVQSAQWLPGKHAILFTLVPRGIPNAHQKAEVVVQALETGKRKTLLQGSIEARYVPTGHLVYFNDGTLFAVRFDPRTHEMTGSAVAVVENVASSSVPERTTSVAHIAISSTGTLAYVTGSFAERSPRTLVWVDRSGREEPLPIPDRPYVYPRLSPVLNDSRVAVTVNDQDRDIWLFDVTRRTLSQFTRDPAVDRFSTWTRDGKRIAFGSNRAGETGLWWQATDGSGGPERLAGFPPARFANFVPTTVSPDGSTLIVSAMGPGANVRSDLWTVKLTGDPQPAPLLETPATERNAEFSPDGNLIAYEAYENNQTDVYVRRFPSVNAGVWPVTSGGGSQPAWASSGKELFFFHRTGTLMSVRVESQSPPTFSAPVKVLDPKYVWALPTFTGRLYDVSRDGKKLLMLKPAGEGEAAASITVVLNWFEELKRLVPTR